MSASESLMSPQGRARFPKLATCSHSSPAGGGHRFSRRHRLVAHLDA